METLGDKIEQLRKELTQEELAVLLQVDRSTLASWEVNRREPDSSGFLYFHFSSPYCKKLSLKCK